MLDKKTITTLEQIVEREHFSCEEFDLICYSYDATQKQFLPDVVVHPDSPEEISRIIYSLSKKLPSPYYVPCSHTTRQDDATSILTQGVSTICKLN